MVASMAPLAWHRTQCRPTLKARCTNKRFRISSCAHIHKQVHAGTGRLVHQHACTVSVAIVNYLCLSHLRQTVGTDAYSTLVVPQGVVYIVVLRSAFFLMYRVIVSVYTSFRT